MNVKQISVSEIRVGERSRKNIGDLLPLMKSMDKRGLINPITVDSKNNLICGERRLQAAQNLGWEEVDCNVVSSVDDLLKLHLEREENECRLDPTPEEKVRIGLRIESLEKPGANNRQLSGKSVDGTAGGRGNKKTLGSTEPKVSQPGRTAEIAAQHVGMSPATYKRARRIVKAADENPGNQAIQDAKEEMNKTGSPRAPLERVIDELGTRRGDGQKTERPKENKVDRRGLPKPENTPVESKRALENLQHAVTELEKMKLVSLEEADATVLSDGIRNIRTRLFRILSLLKGHSNGQDDAKEDQN